MSADAAVRVELDDAVATVTMSRPDRRNAWDDTLGAGLERAFTEVARHPGVRAVVLTGEGTAFCSGADLACGFVPGPDGHDDLRATLRHRFHPAILAMRDVPQPIVAAVNGPAIGAGACLAMAADMSVVAASAFLQFRFAMIGLMPDVGATALLAAAVGPQQAAELLMLADRIDAEQSYVLRLTGRVVDDGQALAEARALAARLAAGPTRAYATTKRALRRCSPVAFAEQLEYEASLQMELVDSEDWKIGRAAFLEHIPPSFVGR